MTKRRILIILIVTSLLIMGIVIYIATRPNYLQKHTYEPYIELTVNPEIQELTPDELLEYMEIFKLTCNKTDAEILAGATDYRLNKTQETSAILEQFNTFTCGLHAYSVESRRVPGRISVINPGAYIEEDFSPEFREIYMETLRLRQYYIGNLTKHWAFEPESEVYFLYWQHPTEFPAEIYRFYKSLPEEIVQRIHTKVDGLTLKEYIYYTRGYSLYEDDKEKSRYEYDGTTKAMPNIPRTQDIIEELNIELWYVELFEANVEYESDLSEEDQENRRLRREIAREYGLSSENPVTLEWVLENPQKAYSIMEPSAKRYYSSFKDYFPDRFFVKIGPNLSNRFLLYPKDERS